MTDPAVEAAQRATANDGGFVSTHDIAAAREALKPIRELHVEKWDFDGTGGLCKACRQAWPCDTAKLVYPESEW